MEEWREVAGEAAEALSGAGVKSFEDILMLTDDDWRKLAIKAVNRRRLLVTALERSKKHWLEVVGLPQYREAFEEFGIGGIQDLLLLGKNDLDSLGVKPFHQKKIMKFAQMWSGEELDNEHGENFSLLLLPNHNSPNFFLSSTII
jgi:hypothetical protein